MATKVSYLSIAQCASGVSDVAVAIDVLRAFTTAAWAFHLGTEKIVLTDDLEEALRLKQRFLGSLALKDGEPAPGFELTNSPAQMHRQTGLRGCTLIQRTTHGTIGAVAAKSAGSLFCASFVCAAATASAIREIDPNDVCLVVTGEDGTADEDLACAEYLAALLRGESPDPAPYLQRVEASRAAQRIAPAIAAGSRGFEADDVAFCIQVDRFSFAMRASEEDGLLILRRFDSCLRHRD